LGKTRMTYLAMALIFEKVYRMANLVGLRKKTDDCKTTNLLRHLTTNFHKEKR
jgi:hypothetical protein